MKYILDTCAISELSFPEEKQSQSFISWLSQHEQESIYLSSIVIGEIQKGIDKIDDSKRKNELITWFEEIETNFTESVLPFDKDVAKTWGTMMAFLQRSGKNPPAQDSMIGATALHHNMILVTRNVKDFVNMPIEVLSPWE